MRCLKLLTTILLFLFIFSYTASATFGDITLGTTDSWRFNGASNAETLAVFPVHNDTWCVVFKGPDDHGFLKTYKIGRMNHTLYDQNKSSAEYCITFANIPDICEVYKGTTYSIFAIATGWQGQGGLLQTINISHTGTITDENVSQIIYDTGSGYYPKIKKLYGHVYGIFFSGQTDEPRNLTVKTVWINDNGIINGTLLDNYYQPNNHKTSVVGFGDHYWAIVANSGGIEAADLVLTILRINESGTINNSYISKATLDAGGSRTPAIYYLGGDAFVITYDHSSDVVAMIVKAGQYNGTIYNISALTTISTNLNQYLNMEHIYQEYFIAEYTGGDSKNWGTVFTVDETNYHIHLISNTTVINTSTGYTSIITESNVNNILSVGINSYINSIYFDVGEIITLSNEGPVNLSTVSTINPKLNITINTTEPEYTNINIITNESGSWVTLYSYNFALNRTISYTPSVFDESKKYYWRVCVTDGSGNVINDSYSFTLNLNDPPVMTNPNPANTSINNQLSFTWNVTISDPNDVTFNWTINCSNGQNSFDTNDNGGSKTLLLSGLAYSTEYTVWVNATDGKDSSYATYTFNTKDNTPPAFSNPNPANESVGISIRPTVNTTIVDADGSLMDVTFASNYTGVWVNYQTNTNVGNGSRSYSFTGANDYSVRYWWKVYSNDGFANASVVYHFDTKANTPPALSNPNPLNNSINNSISLTWNITIKDANGDPINWTIECNNTQNSFANLATNGSKTLALSLAYNCTYTIWVNVTDGHDDTSAIYYFNTSTMPLVNMVEVYYITPVYDPTATANTVFYIAGVIITISVLLGAAYVFMKYR